MDWLTWQGLRGLATVEALVPQAHAVCLATPHPSRPPIKWTYERHWFETAERVASRPGDVLYARTAWRAPARAALVRAVTAPTVMVSTFYDPMIRPKALAEVFTPSSQIQHWFAVQVMARHPRLTPLPMGVEAENVPRFAATEQRADRDIPLYVNFAVDRLFMQRYPIRQRLWPHFAAQAWVTAEPPGDPNHYVRQLGRSRFVLSPPGYGWDCYRTYEALVMGAIPIVKREPPQSDVHEGLPVLMVDRWRDVTPERLQHEWETRQAVSLERITLAYWRARIQAAARAARSTT